MENKYLIIDFDSTFIDTEALDELALITLAKHPQGERIIEKIRTITQQGMEGKIPLSVSLARRIKLLGANKADIEQLILLLQTKVSHSFKRNIAFLKQFAAHIYIISSGFMEYILPVVTKYGIQPENVFANSFIYAANGNIDGLDSTNPLCQDQGKVKVVRSLQLQGTVWVVGDGITDYEIRAAQVADAFYAFTENVERASVIDKADIVIKNFDEFLYMHDFPRAISYPRNRIKILLLENIHPHAIQLLKHEGYTVEWIKGSLSEEDLCAKIKDISILGIRSKTMLTQKVLAAAERLIAIGAFCIGTNQINLDYATQQGICVFNAPYSNTRSVVELVLGQIIMLMRKVISKNTLMHQGKWDKTADNCFELRGKKLGIIGYGNIGSQLSVLAEAIGMQVYYYDVVEKLQLGNAKRCATLEELLVLADVVSLHVDGRKSNTSLIGESEFALMKDKAIFINLSRGHVVDMEALVTVLESGRLLGAAVDVFPYEPQDNQEQFISQLQGIANVILTPHIGGSTEEAQLGIGEFVAKRLINYINMGDTTQSVNLPNIQLPELKNAHRLIHLHSNVPGILAQINQVLAEHKANILGQYLKTNEQVGYVISDINVEYEKGVLSQLKKIEGTIKARVLY